MTESIVRWIFDKLSTEELAQLAYELGRRMPIEASRGVEDARAGRTIVKPHDVLTVVASCYDIPVDVILGRGRTAVVAAARHAAYELLRRGLGMSLMAIAELMDRDHTSVMNGLKAVDTRRYEFRQALNVLREMGMSYVEFGCDAGEPRDSYAGLAV